MHVDGGSCQCRLADPLADPLPSSAIFDLCHILFLSSNYLLLVLLCCRSRVRLQLLRQVRLFQNTFPLFFSDSFPSLLAVTSISNTVVGLTQPLIVAPSIASADFEQLNAGLVTTMAVAGALCCFFLMASYRRAHALVQAQQQLRSAV